MKEREKTAFPQKCQKMEEKVTHCMRMRKEIKIGDLSYFSGVLSYDTRQEADIISAWILKNRKKERTRMRGGIFPTTIIRTALR